MGMVSTTAEDVETARDRANLAASKITVGPSHSEYAQGASEEPALSDAPIPDIDVIEVAEPVIDVDPKLTRSADD